MSANYVRLYIGDTVISNYGKSFKRVAPNIYVPTPGLIYNPISTDKSSLVCTGPGTAIGISPTDIVIAEMHEGKLVLGVGNEAFSGCEHLSGVTIPDSAWFINDKAFYNCTILTTVNIPNSVTKLGESVFEKCTSLTSVDIPNSVTTIGAYLFRDCTSLTSIVIPDSVTSLGASMCTRLTNLKEVIIGRGVQQLTQQLYGCTGIVSLTIPYLGRTADETDSNYTLGYLFGSTAPNTNDTYVPTSLSNVVITGGSKVLNFAFWNCKSIQSITLPESITSMGSSLFYGCSKLQSITIKAKTPPAIQSGSLSDLPSGCKIYIPAESVDAYKSATNWSASANRIVAIEE